MSAESNVQPEFASASGLHASMSPTGEIGFAVFVLYTNYRGETAVRQIIPQRLWFGATSWHPEAGWLLDAIDVEKDAVRSFAMKDIKAWYTT